MRPAIETKILIKKVFGKCDDLFATNRVVLKPR